LNQSLGLGLGLQSLGLGLGLETQSLGLGLGLVDPSLDYITDGAIEILLLLLLLLRGGRRYQMLHDLANDGGCVALKWAAKDREGWRHRERMLKTCSMAED